MKDEFYNNLDLFYVLASKKFEETLLGFAGNDINRGEVVYIEVIESFPNMTTSELSELLNVTKPAVSYNVNNLIDKGYIKKTVKPEDRRSYGLVLTDRFPKLCDKVNKEMYKEIIDELSEEEVKTVNKFLIKTINHFK